MRCERNEDWPMITRCLKCMNRNRARCFLTSVTLCGLLCISFFQAELSAQVRETAIASRTAEVEGVKLHYLISGHGSPVLLLHGYAETSLMWRPVLPMLAQRAMVIAPDLPGIGGSSIPSDGLDMKTAAVRI